jgi:uncharacterized membrane protein
MNYKNLLFIFLLAIVIGCNSQTEDNNTKSNIENIESANIENNTPQNKVNQEDALKGLKGDDKDVAKWLYENYKGRINEDQVTLALSEMAGIAIDIEYDEGLDEKEIKNSIGAYCEKYKGKIDLSHFKAKHSCMHGFMGADEINPYFTEFKFIGKTEEGNYAFNCTFTAENSGDVKEMKYLEVIKNDNSFTISMIICREIINIEEKNVSSLTTFMSSDLAKKIENNEIEVIFHAFGTEPFWDIFITANYLLFSELNEETSESYSLLTPFDEKLEEQVIKVQDSSENTFKLLLKKEPTSDGMSDKSYPYSVKWSKNELNGAGHLGK